MILWVELRNEWIMGVRLDFKAVVLWYCKVKWEEKISHVFQHSYRTQAISALVGYL